MTPVDAGAQRGAGDFEFAGEFALGRQAIAGAQGTGGDEAADVFDDLEGELAMAARLFAGFLLLRRAARRSVG